MRFVPGLLVLALVALLAAPAAEARREAADALPQIAVSDLPKEARDTLDRIRQGGPFPYQRDGIAFGNRERMLPSQSRGYYREYTVNTPRTRDRGARRIVCGGDSAAPEECYYSDDHYRSFKRIQQ
jgi:ribonuclease T1